MLTVISEETEPGPWAGQAAVSCQAAVNGDNGSWQIIVTPQN